MKVKSDNLPQNDFEINNIQDNTCDVVFFDVKNHKEEQDENGKVSYEYESYTITTTYRSSLGADISKNYDKWYNYAIQYNKDVLAAQIRAKRNELLNESDKEVAFDRLNFNIPTEFNMTNLLSSVKNFFDSLMELKTNEWAKYRQELRDITEQPDFPYSVVFPEKPSK